MYSQKLEAQGPLELKIQAAVSGYWELNLPFAVDFHLLPLEESRLTKASFMT